MLEEDFLQKLFLRSSKIGIVACFLQNDEWTLSKLRLIECLANHVDVIVVPQSTQSNRPVENPMFSLKAKVLFDFNINHCLNDFALYYSVLHYDIFGGVEKLVVLNDSVSVIHSDFSKILKPKHDFYGLTKNFAGTGSYPGKAHRVSDEHIQSQFLVAQGRAIQPFLQFFHRMKPLSEQKDYCKFKLVHEFEIGLSQWMLSQNFQCNAVYDYDLIEKSFNIKINRQENVSQHHWFRLLVLGCPLQKNARNTSNRFYDERWIQCITNFHGDFPQVGTIANPTNGNSETVESQEKFDHVSYANHQGDLLKAFGQNKFKLWNHWKTYGKSEGRTWFSVN